MKKITSFLFSLLLLSTFSYSQAPIEKGEKQLNFGLGLSNYGLPVYVGMDFGLGKNFSAGPEFSYRSHKENVFHDYHWKHTIMTFAGNVNYHFNELFELTPEWNIYAGASLGYTVWSTTHNLPGDDDQKYSANSSGLNIYGQAGIRYFFNEKWGLNLEFGGGNYFSGGKFGLTLRL